MTTDQQQALEQAAIGLWRILRHTRKEDGLEGVQEYSIVNQPDNGSHEGALVFAMTFSPQAAYLAPLFLKAIEQIVAEGWNVLNDNVGPVTFAPSESWTTKVRKDVH